MPTPADIPEGLELRKDGTIVMHLDDDEGRNRRVQLRRPKFRELRRLRQDEWDIADQIRTWLTTAQAELDGFDLDSYDKDADIPRDVRRQVTEITRRIQRDGAVMAEDLRLSWAEDVIRTLSGTEVNEDDLPPWCASADFAAQTLNHWLMVPTRRGSP